MIEASDGLFRVRARTASRKTATAIGPDLCHSARCADGFEIRVWPCPVSLASGSAGAAGWPRVPCQWSVTAASDRRVRGDPSSSPIRIGSSTGAKWSTTGGDSK